jgi:hypothetical protein
MATASQINYKLEQTKKKLAKLEKEFTATKADIKELELEFKKARIALIAKAAEKIEAKKRSAII